MNIFAAIIVSFLTLYLIYRLLQSNGDKNDKERYPASNEDNSKIYEIANELNAFYFSTAHPKDLLADENFIKGVNHLKKTVAKDEDLIKYGAGNNEIIASMALEALHLDHSVYFYLPPNWYR